MGWKNLFGSNDKKRNSKKTEAGRRGSRTVRFEQMERRNLLSVAPAALPEVVTELGHVDYRDVDAADQTYGLTTRHDGVLTALLEGAGDVALYDADYNLIDSATGRLDQDVVEGETYYVTLSGTAADQSLWLANLLDDSTTDLTVQGTTQNDSYVFDWTADGTGTITDYQLLVNQVSYTFTAAEVATVSIDAGPGRDTAVVTTDTGNDTATMRPGDVQLDGTIFDVSITDAEDVRLVSGGGYDYVDMHDSAGNDTLEASDQTATLSSASFSNRADGFSEVHAVSDSGGYDVATLNDSADTDEFIGRSDVASLGNANFFNEARAFDEVHAYSLNGGDDTAEFYDSAGDDTFVAREEVSRLSGDGFFNRAKFFKFVTGYATAGGQDVAHLHDSAGDDLFSDTSTVATMSAQVGSPDEGLWSRQAVAFAEVYGYASQGTDTVSQSDSAGDDTYTATPTLATMSGASHTSNALGFDHAVARATAGGVDVASLFDTSGDDTYEAAGGSTVFTGTDVSYQTTDFEQTHAYSTAGGIDVASLFDTAGDDAFVGRPDWSRMSGQGYFNRVKGFEQIHGYATGGGDDTAQLFGSTGDDYLVSDPDSNSVRMVTGDVLNRVKFFETVQGYAASGGTDVAKLKGSDGDDTLVGDPTVVSLTTAGTTTSAIRFGTIVALAGEGGTDVAELSDSAGSETFTATPTQARLAGSGFEITAKAFDQVHAYARAGGSDTAVLYGSTGADAFVGTSEYGKLSGIGFFNRTKFFDSVIVHGMDGADTATLYDSPGNDEYLGNGQVRLNNADGSSEIVDINSSKIALRPGNDELYAGPDVAQVRSVLHVVRAYGFETVDAYSKNGGVDTKRFASPDFILNQFGPWIDPSDV